MLLSYLSVSFFLHRAIQQAQVGNSLSFLPPQFQMLHIHMHLSPFPTKMEVLSFLVLFTASPVLQAMPLPPQGACTVNFPSFFLVSSTPSLLSFSYAYPSVFLSFFIFLTILTQFYIDIQHSISFLFLFLFKYLEEIAKYTGCSSFVGCNCLAS